MANIFLFGDQTADQTSLLQKLVLRHKNPLLAAFLEQTSVALRQEVSRLPQVQRQQIPSFLRVSTLFDLYTQQSLRNPILDSALTVIAQLGHFIGYVVPDPLL